MLTHRVVDCVACFCVIGVLITLNIELFLLHLLNFLCASGIWENSELVVVVEF